MLMYVKPKRELVRGCERSETGADVHHLEMQSKPRAGAEWYRAMHVDVTICPSQSLHPSYH